MKEFTKKRNGKVSRCIYTTSCVPNQKPKRIRKQVKQITTPLNNIVLHNNVFGIIGAIVTVMSTPLSIEWKAALSILFLLSSFYIEIKE